MLNTQYIYNDTFINHIVHWIFCEDCISFITKMWEKWGVKSWSTVDVEFCSDSDAYFNTYFYTDFQRGYWARQQTVHCTHGGWRGTGHSPLAYWAGTLSWAPTWWNYPSGSYITGACITIVAVVISPCSEEQIVTTYFVSTAGSQVNVSYRLSSWSSIFYTVFTQCMYTGKTIELINRLLGPGAGFKYIFTYWPVKNTQWSTVNTLRLLCFI